MGEHDDLVSNLHGQAGDDNGTQQPLTRRANCRQGGLERPDDPGGGRRQQAFTDASDRMVFALNAAQMATWEWDLGTNAVRWSDNLERMHGVPAGTFSGGISTYEG